MTTQHHPRPASFAGPIVFVAGLAAVAGIAAVGLTRYDGGGDSGASTKDVSQGVWIAPAPPTADRSPAPAPGAIPPAPGYWVALAVVLALIAGLLIYLLVQWLGNG